MSTTHTTELPEWLRLYGDVIGSDGETEVVDAGKSGENPDNSEDDDSGDDETEEEDIPKDAPEPLKKALIAERKGRKAAEKEARSLKKERDKADREKAEKELAEKGELEQATTKLTKAEDRVQKLASGYLRTAVDREIERAAASMKFLDPEDAIAGVERQEIETEQDEDDPSLVTVNRKSVLKAVKALAEKKPHYLGAGTDDGEPTGSRFGGSKTGSTKKADEDTLRGYYPGL